ncbi:hypothetical protein E4U43_002889 [Claviceps pusilla]|uniref:Uncharacterized protein n=1 Tax=Claviceps pusilla TaxID=123648 RepID=A0A9P7N820_9HYPO|nr:hypothetical protein E4U43_002889 [Claviceps pusilla]
MFDLPDAKRVRREDLNDEVADAWSHGADESIDPDLQARVNEQIAKSLGFSLDSRIATHEERSARPRGPSARRNSQLRGQGSSSGSKIQEQQDDDNDDDDDDIEHDDDDDIEHDDDHPGAGEFEFRLFSSRPPTKVTLEDDDTATAREGAIVTPRPPSFYLASHMRPTLKSECRVAAVSGEDVVLRSHRPAWGMAYPWRVVTGVYSVTRRARGQDVWSARLDADTDKKVDAGAGAGAGADGETRRRKRPGKKSRIANRQKAQAERQRQEMEKKKAMDKEELVKEKKKRLNRLKKLRKRAKNKEMKAGGREDDGEGDGDGDGGSGDE